MEKSALACGLQHKTGAPKGTRVVRLNAEIYYSPVKTIGQFAFRIREVVLADFSLADPDASWTPFLLVVVNPLCRTELKIDGNGSDGFRIGISITSLLALRPSASIKSFSIRSFCTDAVRISFLSPLVANGVPFILPSG